MIIDRKNKEKKKEKKEDENDDNKGKIRKDSKKKMEISWGGVTRPPRQFESYSYSVIRTCDLDDLSCTRCTPTSSVTFRSSSTLLVIAVVFVYKTQGY